MKRDYFARPRPHPARIGARPRAWSDRRALDCDSSDRDRRYDDGDGDDRGGTAAGSHDENREQAAISDGGLRAVKDHRKAAPAIAETAVAAHKDYAGDIVATVVRCANGNCELTAEIVGSAIAAAPESAVAIDDAAVAIAPDCADAIQAATSKSSQGPQEALAESSSDEDSSEGSSNFGAPPSTTPPVLLDTGGGGGGANPQTTLVSVCDNGHDRRIRE